MPVSRPVSRRQFLAGSAALGGGLFLSTMVGGQRVARAVPLPAGALADPTSIPQFVTPLLVPPVMPTAGRVVLRGGRNADYYRISMRQFPQQLLPAGMPATTVWGYGAVASDSRKGLLLHNAPSLTIEARWNRPVRITWINELVDEQGNFLPHLLPVDPTLHWANPPGGEMGRDTRPTWTSTPGAYQGPVPTVTHVHGAVGVGDESDGYPEAWYLPAASNIPAGYATEGRWYDYFRQRAQGDWGPGRATFDYPNENRASTLWYHDHTLGMTRLNVYAGPAGFYLVRGGPQGDDAVIDTRTDTTAVLPGPAPGANDGFPARKTYYEIPLAIQDRTFAPDGSLFYPDTRQLFDGVTGPYVPDGDFSPLWNPEFFGNTLIVNGATWPFHTVEQRRYRLRFLNGCQSRFLILDFRDITGVEVWQIGNEGGFLPEPLNLTAMGNTLLLALAERADLVVDFTNVPTGSYTLRNLGPDEPFGGGVPGVDFTSADPATTGSIMEFRVVPSPVPDPTTPPRFLRLPYRQPMPPPVRTRSLALIEQMGMGVDEEGAEVEGPSEALLGVVVDGYASPRMWMDEVTENPDPGDTEVWEIYNTTGDAHPMHVHEVAFEVVDRQDLVLDPDTDEPVVPFEPTGPLQPPEPWEGGVKDMVVAYPGQVTRIKATFTRRGQYVWHCHIVEHEDNEMMRPYRIGPADPDQPAM